MIEVSNVNLTYPSKKGIFDVNFKINPGEVVGYLGPNGAGKTTTIRVLLGFMKADSGSCTINGLDCFEDAKKIQKMLGYIPGEIAFFDDMKADEFLKFMNKMRGNGDLTRQKELVDMFEFEPKGKIKKFSKGMKQKLGIVAAFMHNPEVVILDEPTSGLDPLMQARFVELIEQEKKKGKTILMSSHMFEEVEKTCDNVLIIKEGKIIKQSDVKTLKSTRRKGFLIKSQDPATAQKLLEQGGFTPKILGDQSIELFIKGEQIGQLMNLTSSLNIIDFDVKAQTLEDIFLHLYAKEEK